MEKQAQVERQIVDVQRKIAEEVWEKTDGRFYLLRNLIGPPSVFSPVDKKDLDKRVFPWPDGEWAPGVELSDGGNTVTFKMRNPKIEQEGATPEEMLSFIYYYLQYQTILPDAPPEMPEAMSYIETALLKLLAASVRYRTRGVVRELMPMINFGGQQMPRYKHTRR